MTADDLYQLVRTAVSEMVGEASTGRPSIVSGRKNIASALGISVDKLDKMIAQGDLGSSIKRNGRSIICDIDKAFDAFNDKYN